MRLQAVELARGRRQHQSAVGMQAAGLARERLDLPVQVDGVLLQARDVRLAVEGVHAAGGVPGGAGGQLALLQQQHVGPADLGQVIEHARPDHAAADHDRPRRSLHMHSRSRRPGPLSGTLLHSPKGRAAAASHSAKCCAVLEGVSSSMPRGSAARITGTCAMTVAAALPARETPRIQVQPAAAREQLAQPRCRRGGTRRAPRTDRVTAACAPQPARHRAAARCRDCRERGDEQPARRAHAQRQLPGAMLTLHRTAGSGSPAGAAEAPRRPRALAQRGAPR